MDIKEIIQAMMRAGAITRKTVQFHVNPDRHDGTLLESVSESGFAEDGAIETVEYRMMGVLDCGHVIRSYQEYGGQCSCGALLCYRCFTRCRGNSCLRPLGPCCSYVIERGVYCRSCSLKLKMKKASKGTGRALYRFFNMEL
jgi:hypothetical protein